MWFLKRCFPWGGWWALAAFLLGACIHEDGPSGPQWPDGPAYQASVQPIFDAYCIECHVVDQVGWQQTGGPNNGLDLTASNSRALLVDVITAQLPDSAPYFRVVPGKPDESYLIQKMESLTPKFGRLMPLLSSVPLDSEAQIIRDWITAGALNN